MSSDEMVGLPELSAMLQEIQIDDDETMNNSALRSHAMALWILKSRLGFAHGMSKWFDSRNIKFDRAPKVLQIGNPWTEPITMQSSRREDDPAVVDEESAYLPGSDGIH